MNFSDMSVITDGIDLIKSSKGKHLYTYEFEFIVGEYSHRVTKVLAVHTTRDFINNKFDKVTVDLMVGLGTWLHDIVPNRTNLRAKLFMTPTVLSSGIAEPVGPTRTSEWKVILNDSGNEAVSSANEVTQNKEEANQTRINPYTVTLIKDDTNCLRTAKVSGWFLKQTMSGLLKGLFMTVGVKRIPSKAQYLQGEYEGVVGVQMVPADNAKAFNHTYLSENTSLRNLPSVLQEINGVYNNGIANYFHKGLWYVYPVTNVKRFEEATSRLVIYNIPKDKMYGIDRTFTYRGKELHVIATSDMIVKDTSELEQFNKGSSVRIAAAANMMDTYLNIDESGNLVGKKSSNILEGTLEVRDDGLFLMKEESKITNNSYAAMSDLNKGSVSEYFIKWDNSDCMVISPGMPVRIFYTKKNEAYYVDGMVAGIDTSERLPDGSVGKTALHTSSLIRIIGERA